MSVMTLDKLKEAMRLVDSIPPPPVFCSSKNYPADSFWQFEREGREYVLGHPSLWAKAPAQPASYINPLASIPIVDVDAPNQGELRAKIRFWVATASHRPGEPPKWPKNVAVVRRAPDTFNACL